MVVEESYECKPESLDVVVVLSNKSLFRIACFGVVVAPMDWSLWRIMLSVCRLDASENVSLTAEVILCTRFSLRMKLSRGSAIEGSFPMMASYS
jgi:hypothetical protein